jgi:threonine dehydrogenase-like Zn-dependent dehydrogenase
MLISIAEGWAHYFEILLGAETDTSEIINEMITSVKNFGRVGITGVYVGFVSIPYVSTSNSH